MTEPDISLNQLQAGAMAIVARIETDESDAARIKRMGICEGRRIQLVKAGDPMIIRVVGTRVGLSARLAPGILVHPCQPPGSAAAAVSPTAAVPQVDE